ncbi:MAG: DUF1353 domain-containing protein [Armatimonadia bacterium]
MPELSMLLLEPMPDGKFWRVHQPYRYQLPDGRIHEVPEGRLTDLASTPVFLWRIYPPFGKYTRAAVLHDDFYKTGRIAGVPCERGEADDLLAEVMAEWGCSEDDCQTFHDGVRIGGGWTWAGYREAEIPRSEEA